MTTSRVLCTSTAATLAACLSLGAGLLAAPIVVRAVTQASAGRPAMASELARVSLPGPVWSLAYDESRNAIWFSFFTSEGPDYLYGLDVASASITKVELPDVEDNGYLGQTAVAPDGAVWVTEPYTLVRFNPATGAMAALDYSPDAAGSLATDANPGTWLSPIAFDASGRAFVPRHNLPYVNIVSQTLTDAGQLPLPLAYAGPRSVALLDGRLLVSPPIGNASLPSIALDMSGTLVAQGPIGSAQFSVRNGHVLAVGAASSGWSRKGASAVSGVTSVSGTGYFDRGAIAPDESSVLYMSGTRQLIRLNSSGQVAAALQLPEHPITVVNPMGHAQDRTTGSWTTSVVVDASNHVWYADLDANTLVCVSL